MHKYIYIFIYLSIYLFTYLSIYLYAFTYTPQYDARHLIEVALLSIQSRIHEGIQEPFGEGCSHGWKLLSLI